MAGKGVVVRWERMRRQNHWFDALYNACAAGQALGVRLVVEHRPEPPPRKELPPEEQEKYVSWAEIRDRYKRYSRPW